ncbi:PepSY-associated TM helix domain-containing protein [Halarcobacter ebronensis]|uniref:Peptidase n=1 Tax=Halarcobacter ebronensis TaxID=1462615 RepID=A0A4Q1AS75_9BACT|nr:PepSY-associated TM helix domain-containing protein [Halarcobacter ebronensis]QKF81004.1 PepSY domain-containing membrane protein [Halarcobacter ebronensis]RXK06318.1 peptidase [Halarcobacter ebronensis]
MKKSQLFKQRLFRVHIAAGVTFSLIMYLSLFFGVFAIMLPYIKNWEKPSRHLQTVNITTVDYNSMIDEVFKDPNFPQDNALVNLPGRMNDPMVTISHRFVQPIAFNPLTGEKVEDESKKTSDLANFLNELHYGAPLNFIGRLSFGFVAVGTMVLIITGLVLIYLFNFNNQGKNQQAIFSKIHVKVFTWLFVPFFLIVLSGAVMNVGLVSSSVMSKILTKGEANAIDGVVGKVLFSQKAPIKKENEKTKMLPLSQLITKAQKINPNLTFKQVKLINWNDKTARVEIIGYNPYKPFLNGGVFNLPSVTLSAVNEELIENKKVLDNSWPVFVAETIFFLHFLFGIDIFSRVIVALMMVLCCIAIGFGVMLWLEKKAKKFDSKIPFYHWMGKLSLACMIGVIPATATLFLLQWSLPFDLEDRVLWQKGIFYNVWLFTLFWSFYRINSYKAAKEFLFISGVFFILSSLFHYIYLKTTPIALVENSMTNIFGVDFTLVIFGLILIYVAKVLPKNRENAKIFWPKKEKKVIK